MNTQKALSPIVYGTAVRVIHRALTATLTDRVIIASLLTLGALAVLDAGQAQASVLFTAGSLLYILPFLLVAVTLAAASRATGADSLIAGAFTGRPARAVVFAAFAGALSPFCSCGVIPVIAALLRARVPLAPVMAFWIASPIMDPEMFVLTAAGIGIGFALIKTAATIVMGLLAGYGVYALQQTAAFSSPLREETGRGSCAAGLSRERIVWRFWLAPARRATFLAEVAATSTFLGQWLMLAFFLESLMTAYIPPEWIGNLLGSGAWYEIPVAALTGVPAYLNGYAAIPLMARLIDMGMNPGAALAFMTAGGVSSLPAALAVAVLVRRPVFIAYLTLGLAGSIVTGVLSAAIL